MNAHSNRWEIVFYQLLVFLFNIHYEEGLGNLT